MYEFRITNDTRCDWNPVTGSCGVQFVCSVGCYRRVYMADKLLLTVSVAPPGITWYFSLNVVFNSNGTIERLAQQQMATLTPGANDRSVIISRRTHTTEHTTETPAAITHRSCWAGLVTAINLGGTNDRGALRLEQINFRIFF